MIVYQFQYMRKKLKATCFFSRHIDVFWIIYAHVSIFHRSKALD